MLKHSLDKIELLETFNEFLNQGILYLINKDKENKEVDKNNENNMLYITTNKNNNLTYGSLPSNAIEKMKDILYDINKLINKLKTGLNDSNTYSTVSDDYINDDDNNDNNIN